MIQKKIKKSKARKLFRKNAFIIGLVDGVLATTAEEFFGKTAVSRVRCMSASGSYVTQVFPGDGYVEVLTYEGFLYAAGFRNEELLAAELLTPIRDDTPPHATSRPVPFDDTPPTAPTLEDLLAKGTPWPPLPQASKKDVD